MGKQKDIAEKISKAKADYVLALKGNHGLLYDDVKKYWEDPPLPETAYQSYETSDKGHGRIEVRRYRISEEVYWLTERKDWAGLKTIGMVESRRIIGEKENVEKRYYLCSLGADAKEFAEAVRGHWAVENSLHWVLDVSFREDECRVRLGHAAKNFSLMRKMALMMLKKDTSSKSSIKGKRQEAGWNHDFLERVLFNY